VADLRLGHSLQQPQITICGEGSCIIICRLARITYIQYNSRIAVYLLGYASNWEGEAPAELCQRTGRMENEDDAITLVPPRDVAKRQSGESPRGTAPNRRRLGQRNPGDTESNWNNSIMNIVHAELRSN